LEQLLKFQRASHLEVAQTLIPKLQKRGARLKMKKFTYLGSVLRDNVLIDDDIKFWISKTAGSFGHPQK